MTTLTLELAKKSLQYQNDIWMLDVFAVILFSSVKICFFVNLSASSDTILHTFPPRAGAWA